MKPNKTGLSIIFSFLTVVLIHLIASISNIQATKGSGLEFIQTLVLNDILFVYLIAIALFIISIISYIRNKIKK